MSNWSCFDINNAIWNVPNRYVNLNPLGYGAYGLVCSALDKTKQQQVAIKKLSQPFATRVHAKRAYREIKLLKHVDHDNIIRLLDIFTPANSFEEMQEVCLVTNLMTSDLRNVLNKQQLSEDQIKFFIFQIFCGLKYLHSANIFHRDLKPENLTVNEDCSLRIIDFGLARSEAEENTIYVTSRWYRAPEIMLRWSHYTKAVDIWSVGCILAEMYIQRPLFPGSDHLNQLNRILDVVGYPSDDLLKEISDDARLYLESTERRPKSVNFTEYFREIQDPTALDLIEKMLQLDPNNRITCDQALNHPYLEAYHDDDDDDPKIGQNFDDRFETQNLSELEWKKLIFDEIKSFV
ncbi:unnamed protein product [Brachionus calyciflorus]|uniref:Mitogen-activated protein kinase n=1 Tax=Brachionus calyciflorus TaxID=104777 RepID=A0A814GS47_9BILA|nr:unnamed protein product [Brachionus calyciflorus]